MVRSADDSCYQVVGSADIRRLENAEALLGPLAEPWLGRNRFSSGGCRAYAFTNTVTGEVTTADPILSKELPAGWTFGLGCCDNLFPILSPS